MVDECDERCGVDDADLIVYARKGRCIIPRKKFLVGKRTHGKYITIFARAGSRIKYL